MKIFDSHCHLDDKSYDKDMDAVLQRAEEAGLCGMMIVGINLQTSRKAIWIAQAHKQIYTSVGIHPHDASACSEEDLAELTDLARNHDCVHAWGEIGLDFNRMYSPQEDQERCFVSQLETANHLGLPMIFHERDSNGRFYELLKAHGPKHGKGVVHCFSGTEEEMFKYLDLGYHIGITGILTIKQRGRYLRSIAPLIPDDRILIETDAPYLTPAPQKNKVRRNEPAFVKSVLLRLAEIKQMDVEKLADIILENTKTLYGIPAA